MLERFLSRNDQGRAQRVIQKLARHNLRSWVLTGGIAVEIHHLMRGAEPVRRPLNDIDFLATAFDCLPKDLRKTFLFRHVHPFDPPGKTMLQAIDVDEAIASMFLVMEEGHQGARRLYLSQNGNCKLSLWKISWPEWQG
jgi:hypothetical protein